MSSSTNAPPRFETRLRSPRALKDAMAYNRLTIRQLAEACGSARHRSTLGHLTAGTRTTCSPLLARRVEEVLRLYPGALFDVRVTSCSADTARPALTRERRRAA